VQWIAADFVGEGYIDIELPRAAPEGLKEFDATPAATRAIG
jgi:hypothetical protein